MSPLSKLPFEVKKQLFSLPENLHSKSLADVLQTLADDFCSDVTLENVVGDFDKNLPWIKRKQNKFIPLAEKEIHDKLCELIRPHFNNYIAKLHKKRTKNSLESLETSVQTAVRTFSNLNSNSDLELQAGRNLLVVGHVQSGKTQHQIGLAATTLDLGSE